MKLMKRSGIYQCSNYNCTFDPKKVEAHSYRWWKFVSKVDGVVIFNDYYYSPSTRKHQGKVSGLLRSLNIKVDITAPFCQGIPSLDLASLIVLAEENLCDQYLAGEIKKEERNANARRKRFSKKLEDYLENEAHFRDYEIKEVSRFGSYNKIAIHQVVKDIEQDVGNALESLHRDGFPCVVFYV